jgi:hypothetical protein
MKERWLVIGSFYEKSAHLGVMASSEEEAITYFKARFGERVDGFKVYAHSESDPGYWGLSLFNKLWESSPSYFAGYTYA